LESESVRVWGVGFKGAGFTNEGFIKGGHMGTLHPAASGVEFFLRQQHTESK